MHMKCKEICTMPAGGLSGFCFDSRPDSCWPQSWAQPGVRLNKPDLHVNQQVNSFCISNEFHWPIAVLQMLWHRPIV